MGKKTLSWGGGNTGGGGGRATLVGGDISELPEQWSPPMPDPLGAFFELISFLILLSICRDPPFSEPESPFISFHSPVLRL